MTTVTLRPDHDYTIRCALCGAEGVPMASLPLAGRVSSLCEQCDDCADRGEPDDGECDDGPAVNVDDDGDRR